MGRLIEQLAPEHGFIVHARINSTDDLRQAAGADVAVDFSVAKAVAGNVETLAALKIPIVIGTTGWLDEMERVRAAVAQHQSGLVWSANFSIGMKRKRWCCQRNTISVPCDGPDLPGARPDFVP